ncbi:Sorting nexin mvp1 [Rhodotorula kratochvilovae]
MSSFDQSRGFHVPSGFARQDSYGADPWGSLPASSAAPPPAAPLADDPLPPLSSFANPSNAAQRLDYSVIDEEDHHGEPGGAHARAPSAAAFGDNLLDGQGRDGPWQLPRQQRIEVVLQGDLEGWMVKHHVYQVIQPDKGLSVPRRYSDFVWLLDCLTRRYPFRLLPSLPPKRLQLSGHYLATDELFLERRRRGLERALTALAAHPVVRHDALLAHFLTAQEDLTLYRKTAAGTLSLEEESTQRVLTPREEGSLPADVDARLASVRQRVPALVDAWTRIATVADRLAHRRLNQGKEFDALSEALGKAVEVESAGWRPAEVEQTERETRAASGVAAEVAETEGASARRSLETVVEELKRHREIYTNLRDMFARQASLGGDNVDKLKKRVETNLSKLSLLRSLTPRPASFDADADKLGALLAADQRAIDGALRRRSFVRWCVWEEVRWAWRCTSLLNLTLRDYAASETSYARRLAEQWSALAEALGPGEL